MSALKTAAIALVLATPTLAGCHAIFGSKLAIRPIENGAAPGNDLAYAVGQMEAGRKALDDGQLTAAIVAFRNARVYPDEAAAASNGLAVAYAQLGRPDLAERYFREAVAMEPGDKRFQANLQHFYQLNPVELTMNASDKPASAPIAVPAGVTRMVLASQTGTPTTLVVSQPQSHLVRLSAGEVQIRSASPAPAPAAAPAVRTAEAAYPVRIGFAPREVFVGKAPPPAAVARNGGSVQVAARQQYPLRIMVSSR